MARRLRAKLENCYVKIKRCAGASQQKGRRIPPSRTFLLVLAVAGAGAAIFFLLRFLRANDEHERQINYRALTFAFAGTLAFSAAIGFLQRFGFHPVSWLGIPPLMIILWSLGLILYSWRYR